MTSNNPVEAPAAIQTSLRNPRRWFYVLEAILALWIGYRSIATLLAPPSQRLFGALDLVFGVSGAVCALGMLVAMAAMLWFNRTVVMRIDASGISSSAKPSWSVAWEDIRALRLLPMEGWRQLAIVETPDARARRRVPWWARDFSVPRKTLITSFPAADEVRVRQLLAAHGVAPQKFLPQD